MYEAMAKRKSNPDFLNGIPELLILKLLASRPMHGYELVQAIRTASDSQLHFGEGCIYPLLHRLEKEGALVSRRELVAGRKRLVYRTTRAGAGRLSQSAQQWREVVCAVEKVLHGGEHGGAVAGSLA
jgi:PadR family transcriptional regulator PadR